MVPNHQHGISRLHPVHPFHDRVLRTVPFCPTELPHDTFLRYAPSQAQHRLNRPTAQSTALGRVSQEETEVAAAAATSSRGGSPSGRTQYLVGGRQSSFLPREGRFNDVMCEQQEARQKQRESSTKTKRSGRVKSDPICPSPGRKSLS